MYEPSNVNVSVDQHDKLKKAVQSNKAVTIKVSSNGKSGKNKLLLTPSQIQRIERARLIGK